MQVFFIWRSWLLLSSLLFLISVVAAAVASAVSNALALVGVIIFPGVLFAFADVDVVADIPAVAVVLPGTVRAANDISRCFQMAYRIASNTLVAFAVPLSSWMTLLLLKTAIAVAPCNCWCPRCH